MQIKITTVFLVCGVLAIFTFLGFKAKETLEFKEATVNFNLFTADPKCPVQDMDPETNTHKFKTEMHREIRQKVVQNFKEKKGLLFVSGVKGDFLRQNRQFLYLTGVFYQVYGHYITIDLETGISTLFSPKLPPFELIWHLEKLPTRDELRDMFGVDQVFWTDEFEAKLKEWKPVKIFIDEEQTLPLNPTNAPVDKTLLKNHLYEMRSVKTEKEIRVLRVVNRVSSHAHQAIMKASTPRLNEFQLHSLFKFVSHNCGLRNQSYEPIVGSGRNSGILHYTTNDQTLQNGQMLLVDAGPEYHGYSSDITCSYPVNGKFTLEQSVIYQAVLNVQQKAIKSIKIGMTWSELVKVAQIKMLEELRSARLIFGDIDAMHKLNIHALFQPHGLGHHTGLDVHDTTKLPVGGLKENMVVTIEPGIYFIPYLFENATPEQKKHLNMDLINKFNKFGGVRIEDDIRITATGVEYLSNVPRTIKEIENHMKK